MSRGQSYRPSGGGSSASAPSQRGPLFQPKKFQVPVGYLRAYGVRPTPEPLEKKTDTVGAGLERPVESLAPEGLEPLARPRGAETGTPARDADSSEAVQATSAAEEFTNQGAADEVAPPRPVIEARGAGRPLGTELAALAEAGLGQTFADVRIHSDAAAHRLTASAGAVAATAGRDVFLGPEVDAASPDEDARFVLLHELAHVARHGGGETGGAAAVREDHGAEEEAADRAAAAALAGERGEPGRAPDPRRTLRRFAQGDGSRKKGGHAYMTERALARMKLGEEPRRDVEGNQQWPETRVARMGNWERDWSQVITPATRELLAPLLPVLDIVALKNFGRAVVWTSFGTYDPVEHIDNPAGLRASDVLLQGALEGSGTNPVDHAGGPLTPAGSERQGYSEVDERYRQGMPQGRVMNPRDPAAFKVDETGLAHYLTTSRAWCIATLRQAAALGRGQGEAGDKHLAGPHLFASGVHTLQDFYAHSNFCEVALNLLIASGTLAVHDRRGQRVQVAENRRLDTEVHGLDAGGAPRPDNLTHAGKEVIVTGSFNLTDTLASLLGEATDVLTSLDPFGEGQDTASYLGACVDVLDRVPGHASDFSRTAQRLGGLLVASGERLQQGGAATVGERLVTLGREVSLETHTARKMYRWLQTVSPVDQLIAEARRVPLVGPGVAEAVAALRHEVRELARLCLQAAWKHLVGWAVARMQQTIAAVGQRSNLGVQRRAPAGRSEKEEAHARKFGNVADLYNSATGQPQHGIAPATYLPPSHTEIAKDHGDLGGAGHEEDRAGHAGAGGGHGHVGHWLNPLAELLAFIATEAVGDVMSVLWDGIEARRKTAPMVELMPGHRMFDAVDKVVNRYFCHPADCRETWEPVIRKYFQSMDKNSNLGEQLLERLGTGAVRDVARAPEPTTSAARPSPPEGP